MPTVQQNSGTFTNASAGTFTAALPGASSASNSVVLVVAGNTTITTPANWNPRTSQVNFMGHYLLDRVGFSLSSVVVSVAAGQGTWWIAEVATGTYDISNSANATSLATTYVTPSLTPAAGTRLLIASIASVADSGSLAARTVSGWTNGFLEQADLCFVGNDYPMQGVAILDSVAANGTTAYSTTATYSASSAGRSAIIGSYLTGALVAAAPIPDLTMAPFRR